MNFKSLINKCLEFLVNRLVELSAIILIFTSLLLFVSLLSYSPEDPNFIFPENSEIKNLLGYRGSFIADFFYQSIGLISLLLCFTFFFTGIVIFNKKIISSIFGNLFYSMIYILLGSIFFNTFYTDSFWLINNGNGGFVGKYLSDSFLNSIKENFTGSRLIARSINNFFRSVRLYFLNIKKPEVPGYSGWVNFLYMDIENTDSSLWHPFGFNEGLNKIIKNSMEISSLAKSINAEIYIIIYPWPDSLEYGQDKFNWENFSNKLCSEISCKKIINFFPDFQVIKENNADWLTRLYINGDLHISEYGHKIIATKILKEVF